MDIRIEDISSVKKKISIEVAPERVDEEIQKAYRKISKNAKIKGFRKGKIPHSVLERYYAPQMQEEALTSLINESYFRALTENRIPAVSDPEILESGSLEKGKPFTYEVSVEIKPDVKAQDYEGFSLKKEKFSPDQDVVEKQLQQMRESRAELQVSSRESAVEGDSVIIDFEGFIDGEPFENGRADDYVLELGSGTFIPGFEEQVVGMKRGEIKEIELTFPEEYGNKELAGKPVVFKTKLKEIKEKSQPELDDEFAKEFGVDTLDELKRRIEENYREQEKNRIEGDLKEGLIDALIERNPIEVPEVMVEKQCDHMLDNAKKQLQSQGLSLEMLGMSEEAFRENYRHAAERQVRAGLLFEAVTRQEEIKIESSEIDAKLDQIAESSGIPLETIKQYYGGQDARGNLASQLAEEKVVNFLLEKSEVREVDRAELEEKKDSKDDEEQRT